MEWFYANENDEQIPIEESDLEKLARDGVVKPKTLVWNESLPDWLECQKVKPELFQNQRSLEKSPTYGDAVTTPAPPETAPAPLQYHIAAPGEPPPMHMQRVQGPADGMAVASMVCGIVGLVMSLCYGIGFPVCIVAVVLGHLGRKKLREANHSMENAQLTSGLVMGWIGVGLGLLMIIFWIIYIVFFVGVIGAAAMQEM